MPKFCLERNLRVGQWYVYLYRDVRPGMQGSPLYVGMGQAKLAARAHRMRKHWHRCYSQRCGKNENKLLRKELKAIRRLGLAPDMRVVAILATEEAAEARERADIARYGRRENGTGSLCNRTEGGGGSKGRRFKHRKEIRVAIGLASARHWKSTSYRSRRGRAQQRYIQDHPEEIAARVKRVITGWTPQKRAAQSRNARRRYRENPRLRVRISVGLRRNKRFMRAAAARARVWSRDPLLVARRAATLRETCKSPALRRLYSENTKRFWNSRVGRATKRRASLAMWRRPEYRQRMSAIRRARYKDPAVRARQSRQMKAIIATFTPEQRASLSRQRSRAAKRRWSNTAWRRRTLTTMRAASRRRFGKKTRE